MLSSLRLHMCVVLLFYFFMDNVKNNSNIYYLKYWVPLLQIIQYIRRTQCMPGFLLTCQFDRIVFIKI
jgi:Na+/melibiose symporter-like transporter